MDLDLLASNDLEGGAVADVLSAIRSRRSATAFRSDPVGRPLVEALIEAATWAPNHHLTEPWRFVVLAGAGRAALAGAVAAEITAAGGPKAAAEVAGVRAKLVRSPVVIVVAQARQPDVGAERDLEDYAACSAAVQNLLIAAHAAGLAAKWSTGNLAGSAAAKRHLGLTPADRIVSYVYLGRPAGEAPPSRRRPAAEVTRWHGWDDGVEPPAQGWGAVSSVDA